MGVNNTWLIALFSLWVTFVTAASTSAEVDSLVQAHTGKGGKVNVNSMLETGRGYLYTHPEKALEIARKGVAIAEEQGDPLQRANGYRSLAACLFQVKAEYDSTTFYLQKAEQLYEKSRSSSRLKETLSGLASVYHNMGTLYQVKGDYPEAVHYYIQALRLYDETGNTIYPPYPLSNLSNLYSLVNDHRKAESYARQCIKLSRETGNDFMLATGNINLATALMEQGRHEEALLPLQEALRYGESEGDTYKVFLYHLNYSTYLREHKADYPAVVQELEKAYRMVEEIGDEWERMRHSSALSEGYLLMGEADKAYEVARETLRLANELQSKESKEVSLSVLARIHALRGDYETAFRQLDAAYLLKDTLFNQSNQRHIAFLETEYQTEKKEIRIEALEKQRKLYWIIFIVGMVGLLGFLLALYFRHRGVLAKKKSVEEEVTRLEKEKQLIATRAVLEGETTERTRLARDLHDGLGGMLSAVKLNLFDMKKGNVILASDDVARFNKVVEMLDSSISELRRVAHNMMPDSLSRYGLKVALQDFCDSLPKVQFHFFGDDQRLDSKLEIMIFRSVQELVNNALKHAQAENIHVQIVQQADRVSLTVQDDGVGFDPDASWVGSGLRNIRTRAESVGGVFTLFSAPGKGTEINVEFKI